MKKLLYLSLYLCFTNTAYAYTITHNDYTSNSAVSAAGQNTNENAIVNLLNGNIDNTNLASGAALTNLGAGTVTGAKIAAGTITDSNMVGNTITFVSIASGTVHGSTANSGGSQAQITQGTISTPDLRANAVTNNQLSASGNSGHGTDLTTISITSIGKPILLIGNASISVTPTSGGPSLAGVNVNITRDTTAIAGCKGLLDLGLTAASAFSGNQTLSVSISCVDTPAAGTYTYRLSYGMDNGSFSSAPVYSLNATELRD